MTTSSLRICMVNGQFLPLTGGVERQMYQRAIELQGRGHKVFVVTYRIVRKWPRHEIMDGVKVIRTGGLFYKGKLLRRWGMAAVPVIRELIRRRDDYDVIHVGQMLELAWAATVAGSLVGKPVVMDTACSGLMSEFRYLPEHDGLIGRWMLRTMVRSKALVVARGTDSVPEARAAGISDQRLQLIPYGVDTRKFHSPMVAGDSRPAAPRRCICTARLVPQKALDVLLHAWKDVVAEVPDADLRIVGGGYLRDELVALRHRLGLDTSVDFVGETNDVAGYLAQSDLYVLSSRAEGLPNALLEAMATGLPCVATRVGGTGDVIIDGVTGLLVDPEDAPALAQAILRFMRDPALAHACAKSAQALVQQQFSLDKEIERSLRVYEQMIAPA